MRKQIDPEAESRLANLLLKAAPTFPRNAASLLEEASEFRKYESGTVIIREGQPSGGIFLLIAGSARSSMSVGDFTRRDSMSLPHISAPAVLGATSCMLGEPSALSISASSFIETVFIPQAALLSVLRKFPDAGLAMSQLVGEELTETYAHLARLRASSSSNRSSPLLN